MTLIYSVQKKEAICCFTGHRCIQRADIETLGSRLDEKIQQLIEEKNIRTFIAGGAIGFDMLASVYVMERIVRGEALRLELALPFEGHDQKWSSTDRHYLQRIMHIASAVYLISDQYKPEVYSLRNAFMVEQSQICIAYHRYRRSGTGQTIRYAQSKPIPIIEL